MNCTRKKHQAPHIEIVLWLKRSVMMSVMTQPRVILSEGKVKLGQGEGVRQSYPKVRVSEGATTIDKTTISLTTFSMTLSIKTFYIECHCALKTNIGGRLTVDLLVKVACFIKNVNNIFNGKRS